MSKQAEKEPTEYRNVHSAKHRLTPEELRRRNDFYDTSNLRLKQFERIARDYMRPYDRKGDG